ncbi:MAG: 50S ribosomal protein L3 [Candidatus Zixiibacteriota bacterium]|nr:MAG: 50S ribosomal protein L3 [candidate division Zixibacteria bacterium]
MKELIGKKLGMTRIFGMDGEEIPVSVIEAGPCVVVAKRTVEKDGYPAVQVGYGKRRKSLFTRPEAGHFEKAGVEPHRHLREIRYDGNVEVGQELKADLFKKGERVDITGISRGLGFQGGMRRHHFSGAQKTHGQSDRMRAPGSIGQSSFPSRVFKGMKMAGKMGKDKVTVLNLEVVQVIDEENLILVRGAIPGKTGTLVKIRTSSRGNNRTV